MIEYKNNLQSNIVQILQLPAPEPLHQTTSGWEKVAYLVLFLMLTVIILIIGYFSKRIEHAIAFALILSMVLIVLLMAF
jgi:hypothetical protein